MRLNVFLLILGMALVTYLPRALPAAVIDKLHFSQKTEKFLKLIPYTAMTALIFPGILSSDPARPEMGIVGGLTAGVLALFKCPVMLCVLAAVFVNFLMVVLM